MTWGYHEESDDHIDFVVYRISQAKDSTKYMVYIQEQNALSQKIKIVSSSHRDRIYIY